MSNRPDQKMFSVKFVGGNKAIENGTVTPGTTVREVLAALKLDANEYQLSERSRPEVVFGPDDVLFARINDGDLLLASAFVDAGVA